MNKKNEERIRRIAEEVVEQRLQELRGGAVWADAPKSSDLPDDDPTLEPDD